jgi:hypothetical protein
MNRRSRVRFAVPSTVAAAVAVASLLMIGCGGGTQNVASLLKQTFGPHPPVHSYKLDLAIGIDVHGVKSLSKPLALRLVGPYVNSAPRQLPRFNLDVAVNGGGQTFAATATTTADKAFITIAGTPYLLPDQLFQQFKSGYSQASAQTPKQSSSSFSALGLSPSNWLLNPRRLADAPVGDAETIHIAANVDVPRLLQDVSKLLGRATQLGISVPNAPRSITPQQQQAIAQAVKTASVDIYTGRDDRVLRRLSVAVSLAVPAQSRRLVGGLQSGTISVDYSRTQIDKITTISTPANAHPLSELLNAAGAGRSGALNGLAGAATAGSVAGLAPVGGTQTGGAGAAQSGAAAPTGGASQAAGSAAPRAYLGCLSAAKGDIARIQACAPLLNAG